MSVINTNMSALIATNAIIANDRILIKLVKFISLLTFRFKYI